MSVKLTFTIETEDGDDDYQLVFDLAGPEWDSIRLPRRKEIEELTPENLSLTTARRAAAEKYLEPVVQQFSSFFRRIALEKSKP